MAIIIKLCGLPLEATSVDVRRYFLGITIPDGGVRIVGGDEGIVFIQFASDEDARQAMQRADGIIKNSNIKLMLSSRNEMISVTEAARQRQQQCLRQQQLQQQTLLQQQQPQQQQQHHHHHQQQQIAHNQTQNSLQKPQAQMLGQAQLPQTLNLQPQPFAGANVTPMGPAPVLPMQTPMVQFDGDPRLLSQNYQGMMNARRPLSPSNTTSNNQHATAQQQQLQQSQQQQPQQQQQQQQPPQTLPSPFVDPRILSQNYRSLVPGLGQALQPQQLFGQAFAPNSAAAMTVPSGPGLAGMNLLGGLNMTANGGLGLMGDDGSGLAGGLAGLNPLVVVGGAGPLGANSNLLDGGFSDGTGLLGAGAVAGAGILSNTGTGGGAANRNLSPDNRARMSGMRGGDDKLFANKRCVLAASNIPYRATSKDIIEFLSDFNIKEDCIRRRYNQKGQPTADAKIAFPTPEAAMKALKIMNKKTLCGRQVFLKPV